MNSSIFVFIFLNIFFILNSFKYLKENERIAIFRLGQFYKVCGPGLVYVLPIIDKIIRINLDIIFPNWKSVSLEDLNDSIKKYSFSQL